MSDNDDLFGGNVIFSYSRAQAIEDGVLIDVSKLAKEAGIKLHTVVTQGLYHGYIEPDESDAGEGQDVNGRLWDLFTMFKHAIKNAKNQSEIHFSFVVRKNRKNETVRVYAVCGPGDNREPVLTLLMEGED